MMRTSKTAIAFVTGLVLMMGCGDDDSATSSSSGGSGGACATLCKDSGFTTGTEQKFGQNVTECPCSGGSGTVTKARCEQYCTPLGIAADKALLSGTDKCVCDGSGG